MRYWVAITILTTACQGSLPSEIAVDYAMPVPEGTPPDAGWPVIVAVRHQHRAKFPREDAVRGWT